ncbi:MAG: hypothetical protein MZU97_16950 [Bacillus subtilis]|nr:hypothetical protein [Bacillus subtilis]
MNLNKPDAMFFIIHPTKEKAPRSRPESRMRPQTFPEITGYVTCDADGQHRPVDIQRVANSLKANPQAVILGTRDFSQSNVPKTSRMGNRFSSDVF